MKFDAKEATLGARMNLVHRSDLKERAERMKAEACGITLDGKPLIQADIEELAHGSDVRLVAKRRAKNRAARKARKKSR